MDKVDDPSLLYWKIERGKNSKKITGYLPCHIRVNPDERNDAGLQHVPNDHLVRYMGVNYSFRGEHNRACPSNLMPYYGEEGGDRSKWSPKLMEMHRENTKIQR
jgi:hypothetical protein